MARVFISAPSMFPATSRCRRTLRARATAHWQNGFDRTSQRCAGAQPIQAERAMDRNEWLIVSIVGVFTLLLVTLGFAYL